MKRSAETGFSISNTRPIGPPTVSQSDSARGDHVRRVIQTGIRKMPMGPSARRYQQSKPQQNEQMANGSGNNEIATMSTLATGGGAQTRPSTAGSLATAMTRQNEGQNGGAVGGASRGSSAATTREKQTSPDIREQVETETDFGGQPAGGDAGNGQPSASALPPLRHTHKMGG